MDADVAKNLINIMAEPDSNNNLQRTQLNAQILKALSLMLSVLKQDYIDFLHNNDLLAKFVNFLQINSQKSQKKATAQLPLAWLETKCANMRVKAMESQNQLNYTDQLEALVHDRK